VRDYHHTAAGITAVRRRLTAAGWPEEHVAWVWPLVGGHHGVFPELHMSRPPSGALGTLSGDAGWDRAQDHVMDRLVAELGVASLAELVPARKPGLALQLLMAGIVMMADWISSSYRLTGLATLPEVSIREAEKRAEWLWGEQTVRGGWRDLPRPGPGTFTRRFGAEPRPVQVAAQRAAEAMEAPGLLLIEAPTGAGKTWANLIAAEVLAARFGQDGVFVGMPTGAVAEPTFGIVRDWVTGHDPALRPYVALLNGDRNFEHQWRAWRELPPEDRTGPFGSCGGEDDGDGRGASREEPDAASWFIGWNRGLLCPFVVGSVQELLRAALRTPVASVRMAGLLGKVVVLDEVHGLDVHASRLLLEVVRWLAMARVPVVVASATLTAVQRRALIGTYAGGAAEAAAGDPYPVAREDPDASPGLPGDGRGAAVTAVWHTANGPRHRVLPVEGDHPGPRVEVEVLPGHLSPPGAAPAHPALVERVRKEAEAEGSALVVRATAARAQSFAAELGAGWEGEVVLLHEWLPARLRAGRAADCLRRLAPGAARPGGRRRPLVLVSTGDVAGQAFDIDVGFLAVDLVPVDLLFQYAGRLRRGSRAAPGALGRLLVTGFDPGDGTRGPRFLADAEERHGRHLLLRSAALVLEAAGAAEPWTPSRTAGLVARGYREDVTGLPAAWLPDARDALRSWQREMDRRHEMAGAFTLSRFEHPTGTLEGLHRLSVPMGRDDTSLRRMVQGAAAITEIALLRRVGERYETVLGGQLPGPGTPFEEAQLKVVQEATVEVPERWECFVHLADLGIGTGRNDPLGRVRAIVVDAPEPVRTAGGRLRYDPGCGLVVLPETAG
jgi:CRISPR-associated endonuclease/helicase Cas3